MEPAEPCNLARGVHSSSRPHLGFQVVITQERAQGETPSNFPFKRSHAWVVPAAPDASQQSKWTKSTSGCWLMEKEGLRVQTLQCVKAGSLKDCSKNSINDFWNLEQASMECTGEPFARAQMLAQRTLFILHTQSFLLRACEWTYLAMNGP